MGTLYKWSGTVCSWRWLSFLQTTQVSEERACGQDLSLHLQSTLKTKGCSTYKLFKKIIPPAIAVQKAKNCSWIYSTHATFHIWRGLYAKCSSKAELTTVYITKGVYYPNIQWEWLIIYKQESAHWLHIDLEVDDALLCHVDDDTVEIVIQHFIN